MVKPSDVAGPSTRVAPGGFYEHLRQKERGPFWGTDQSLAAVL